MNGHAFYLAIGLDGIQYAIGKAGTVLWSKEACEWPMRINKPIVKRFVPCRDFRAVQWDRQPGNASDISIGPEGSLWALDWTQNNTDGQIKVWTGS